MSISFGLYMLGVAFWMFIAAVVLLGVLAAWITPSILATTAAVAHAVGEQSRSYGALVISPAGWAVSMLIGFLVLLRTGALRRR